ncbi:hypothetical protein Rwratislav_10388 [Rhodococcus wratislaviensis IFP 2016]|nr:hypothetical protein Rwratislav_10388 [Rhodococcus wratislaviensis IFP 2016]
MTDDDDRRAITAAMQRLFAGTPLRSSGKLDIVTLAQEAGVKRNKLTHKHTDLKDLFYAQRPATASPTTRSSSASRSPPCRSRTSRCETNETATA